MSSRYCENEFYLGGGGVGMFVLKLLTLNGFT